MSRSTGNKTRCTAAVWDSSSRFAGPGKPAWRVGRRFQTV